MLYELGKGKPSSIPFGSHQKANSENWTRIATIKGHTMSKIIILYYSGIIIVDGIMIRCPGCSVVTG